MVEKNVEICAIDRGNGIAFATLIPNDRDETPIHHHPSDCFPQALPPARGHWPDSLVAQASLFCGIRSLAFKPYLNPGPAGVVFNLFV